MRDAERSHGAQGAIPTTRPCPNPTTSSNLSRSRLLRISNSPGNPSLPPAHSLLLPLVISSALIIALSAPLCDDRTPEQPRSPWAVNWGEQGGRSEAIVGRLGRNLSWIGAGDEGEKLD